MNRVEQTASLCNKEEDVIIWRRDSDEYWVSQKYFAKRLDQIEYSQFRTKYQNYSNNPSIKDLGVGESMSIRSGFIEPETPDFDSLLPPSVNLVAVKYSKLKTNDGFGIYFSDDKIILTDQEYMEIFSAELMTIEGDNKPIYAYKGKDLVGIIMPLRSDSHPEVRKVLKELVVVI